MEKSKKSKDLVGSKNIIISIDKKLLDKATTKAKRLDYVSVQRYIVELIRRDVFRKKVGGRPNEIFKAANVLSMKHPLSTKGKPFKI